MANRPRGRAVQPAPNSAPSRSAERTARLEVATAPARARRQIADIGTLLALGLFAVCLALAALHAVLVENQASLDNLIEHNEQRQERIEQMQAAIAYLDSPEGLAEQARSAGLIPAAELVVLTPVGLGLLAPPQADPFSLEASGWSPAEPAGASPTGPAPASGIGKSVE